MAKLDEQGLSTFVQELDKHINTKINRLGKSPDAENVKMADGTSVEETVNANKTSILSIKNLENEEVEVRKIETEESFIAVEDAKNGYFTDIKLEGKTLVNLSKESSLSVMGDGKSNVIAYSELLHKLKYNTQYTIMFDIPGTVTTTAGMVSLYTSVGNAISFSLGQANIVQYKGKKYIGTFTASSDDIVRLGIVSLSTDVIGNTLEIKNIVLIEGDYTDKELSYFEGIKSVGQDVSEISVLSTGHNEFNVLGNGHSEKTIYAFTNNSTDEFLDKIIPYVKYFNNVGSYDKCNNLFDYYFSDGDINVWINLGSFNREEALLNLNCKIAEINKKQDKKRILYYDSDTKVWKKPVLREWDSIEKHSDGKYYYHVRSGEVTLNGSESWNYSANVMVNSEDTVGFYIELETKSHNSTNVLSSHFNSISDGHMYSSNIEGINLFNCDNVRIRINKSKLSTQNATGFEAWQKSNPVTVVYQLAEEKVYECTNLDLISYQDETNYIVNTGAITPKSSFDVTVDITNVVKLLQQRTALGETHEHNYQKRKVTEDGGLGVLIDKTNDLNNFFPSGFYRVELGTKNCPINAWAKMLVIAGNFQYVTQIVFNYASQTTNTIYIRCSNGYKNYPTDMTVVWGNWEKIATTSTYSLLEQQISELETQATENENKISILESENKELKEELTQIQVSIASLVSAISEK